MFRSRRRFLILLLFLPLFLLTTALLYQAGMHWLEGKERSFWASLEWASETLTTTGYGADMRWNHPVMVLFVILVQCLGMVLFFMVFPVYLIPFLESRFEARLPQEAPPGTRDHVVVYRYGPAVETLLEELSGAGVPTVLLEQDEGVARRLSDRGQRVVNREMDEDALAAVRLAEARALIANGSDDENAAFTLSARQLGFTGPILALVEEPFHRRPMNLAGASAVFTPRHILGAALAARASTKINPRAAGVQPLGRNLEVAEIRVHPKSPLAGYPLDEVETAKRTGATVIGQWVGGELVVSDATGLRLQPEGILVVAGSHESVRRLEELASDAVSTRRDGPFVVGGGGEVGRKVGELLRAVGEEVLLIDKRPLEGIDRVGDMLDVKTLEKAEVSRAQAVILALESDSATLFATVILKDLAPEVPVIARVNQAENVERIHRAGADFALSISQVSGAMLAKKLLGQEAVAVDPQLKVLKSGSERFDGLRPEELRLRERTGCSLVAVERGEEVLVSFGPDFRFGPGDAVYVCGSGEAVRRFSELYPSGEGAA